MKTVLGVRMVQALLLAAVPMLLWGCCTISTPDTSLALLIYPKHAWMKDPPRERVRSTGCFWCPKCHFATTQEQQQFDKAVASINLIGRSLRPALHSGKITHEEFTLYSVLLDLASAELLMACESTPATERELADYLRPLYEHAARTTGLERETSRVLAARKGSEGLDAIVDFLGEMETRVR